MKTKLFKTLAATAMSVLAIACAKEPVADNGQQAGVSFTIEVPGAPATRAYGEAEKATKLYYQVFDNAGNTINGLGVQHTDLVGKTAKVNFQLVKDQTYNFVFWAQTTETGYYTIDETEGLKKIKANYTDKLANDENFDAFFATESFKVTGPVTKTVTLKRPFAQINIGTKDQLKAGDATAPAIDFGGAKSSVTVKGVPTVFSPLAATPETMLTVPATVTFASAAIPTEPLNVKGTDYNYLAMNYVFAPAEGTVCDLSAEIALVGREPIQLSSPTTPIKRNWRTNILGSLLTSSVDINVVVDPVFGGNEDIDLENIKNEASLKALFANGGTAKLASDFTVSEPIVLEGKKVVNLNLNGKTLTFNGGVDDEHCCMFRVHEGTLTIDGNGNINGGGDAHNERVMFLAKGTDAHIVINNGNFKMGKTTSADPDWYDCVYASAGGRIDIHGGTFETEATRPNGKHYILNLNNGNPGTITVDGGKFVNYDPTTGDDNLGGNFVADGYTTTASYDSNTGNIVYKVVKVTVTASSEAELISAMTESGSVNLVNQGIGLSSAYLSSKQNTTLTISESGSIYPSATFRTDVSESIFVSGRTLTLSGTGSLVGPSNCTYGNGSQAIFVQGGTVNIYGNLTVEAGSGSAANHALTITNGTANIYGGYFHTSNADGENSEVIYCRPGWRQTAKCNIYGGVFECAGNPKFLLNIKADGVSKTTLLIYGGTFVGFDPANNSADGTPTNYVADGYKSVEATYNGKQAWKVVKE